MLSLYLHMVSCCLCVRVDEWAGVGAVEGGRGAACLQNHASAVGVRAWIVSYKEFQEQHIMAPNIDTRDLLRQYVVVQHMLLLTVLHSHLAAALHVSRSYSPCLVA